MASSSASLFDAFDSALEEFANIFGTHYWGLMAGGFRRLFRTKIKDPELDFHLGRLTCELWYWKYIKKLLICINKCSNADEVLKNWGPLVIKIEATFNEIAEDLMVVCGRKNISKRPLEALAVLLDAEEKIGLCKLEAGEALEHLSGSFGSLEWHLPLFAPPVWSEFLESISQILKCILDRHQGDHNLDNYGRDQLWQMRHYMILPLEDFLGSVLPDSQSVLSSDHMIHNHMIHYFFSHIALVVVRITNQSFQYWINRMVNPVLAKNKMNGLLALQREIDPVTPEFLELILKFLRSVNKINRSLAEYLISYFLDHILRQDWFFYNDYLKKLKPLMIFVINKLEDPNEDVQSLVAEIKPILILVRISCRGVELLHLSKLELNARICLLNAEVFLKQQLNSITMTVEDKVEEEVLKCLGSSSKQPQQKIDDGKKTFMLVDEVAREIACCYQSYRKKKITEDKVRIYLCRLLLKIVIFKAQSSCMEFLKSLNANEDMMGLDKDLLGTLLEGLNVFEAFLTYHEEKTTIIKGMELIFAQIEASARGITSLYYSFIITKITEEMVENEILSFTYLLDKMRIIKGELREIIPGIPRPNMPKVPGLGFIDFLQENPLEQLSHGRDSFALIKHHIERIQMDLKSLRRFFMKLDTELVEYKDLGTRVTDVAYEAGYVIDSIGLGIYEHWQHLLWLHDLRQEIVLIKIRSNHEDNTCDASAHNTSQIVSHTISQVAMPEIGELGVCLTKEKEAIIDRLIGGSSKLDVISIVGMPGIGKTTLASKVYNDPKVAFGFHIRAWCSISQVYAKRELLLGILSDTSGLTDDIHQMNDEDLDLKVYQSLKQRRYLIVLDDVWDTGAWDALEKSLPNDGNGSRILMTSRLSFVPLKAKPDSDPHSLRLLSDEESWELLQMKISHEGCPEELVEVGKEIAKTCKGLPLAIVAVAGVLRRTEKTQDGWIKFLAGLSSHIIDDPQTRCMDILRLSYNHLPDYLKACFLYFGAFLEHKDIPVCKLIRLWVAEGFIQTTSLKCLEDLAEDYLIDLIGRSLVTVSKKGSKGRAKACRIHDLLRELCLKKANEENFLQLITGKDQPYAFFSDMDFRAEFSDYYPSSVAYERYRVCFCLQRKHFISSKPYGLCTRSLIFSATSDTYPRRPYDISFIPQNFKLLKVLDLEDINMGNIFPDGLVKLFQLRYLAVSGHIDSIPPSLANLRKLETLIVRGLTGKIILPDTIWSMARLRHLHVGDYVDFNLQDDMLTSSSQSCNLFSFSSPLLSYGKEERMKRLPNLRKLGCIFNESWNSSQNCNEFPKLDFLIHLESLKISYFGRVLNPCEFTLPLNLTKLTVSSFRLPWIHISAIGRLQNLEVLKLLSRAFEGPTWDMIEGEFLKLKYLKLDNLNIAQWNVSNDHLPNLEQLVIRNCMDLEELPYAFAEIPTLQMIEVQSCGRSTENSVRNIAKEEIEGLKIIINHMIHVESSS